MSTVSTLESEVDVDDQVTWTPESSPGREKIEREMVVPSARTEEKSIELERTRTFGTPPTPSQEKVLEAAIPDEDWRLKIPEKGYVPGRNSVGVAF